jgi:RNA polymerase sigma factor (sigma-70 family)
VDEFSGVNVTATAHRKSLSEQSWDQLFDFLDPTRGGKDPRARDGEAEVRYREITRKLVCFFAGRGCAEAEDLTMETILRVAAKCSDVRCADHNETVGYFYGVARNVMHEWLRDARKEQKERQLASREPGVVPIGDADAERQREAAYLCLERCMTHLTERARRLIVSYYELEKASRIDRHRTLATEFGKSANALRIEVHRIRKLLRQCVFGCVSGAGPAAANPGLSFDAALRAQRQGSAR